VSRYVKPTWVRTSPSAPFRATVILALLAIGLLSSSCGTAHNSVPPAAPGTLRIYSSLPYRGPAARESTLIRKAIDLAIQVDKSFSHIPLDGGGEDGKPSHAIETGNAQRAADDPAAVLYIGPWTSQATGWSLPITSKAGLLHVAPAATWPGLTDEGWEEGEPDRYYAGNTRNFIRLSAPDSWQGRAAAIWAYDEGFRDAVPVYDSSTYSKGLARAFADQWAELAGKPEQVTLPVSSYKPEPTERRAVFFAPGVSADAVELAKRVGPASRGTVIIFSDNAISDSEELAAFESAGTRIVFVYNGARDESNYVDQGFPEAEFMENYRKRTGETSPRAVPVFLLARIVTEANADNRDSLRIELLKLLRANGDRGAERDQTRRGFIDLDERGNNLNAPLSIFGYGEGRLTFLKLLILP
jgi:ABC-type branched-subunit amino acid transport system substrate-binding protein